MLRTDFNGGAPSSRNRVSPVGSVLMSTESYSISRTARYDLTPMHELQPGFQKSVGRGVILLALGYGMYVSL